MPGKTAPHQAPLPESPALLCLYHIRHMGYFNMTDLLGDGRKQEEGHTHIRGSKRRWTCIKLVDHVVSNYLYTERVEILDKLLVMLFQISFN